MIYPLSDPDLPFLGIHLTKTVEGALEAGPNAVFAFAKVGYSWKKVNFSAGIAGAVLSWRHIVVHMGVGWALDSAQL